MDFEFSAEQEELRTTVRRLLADRAPLTWVRERLGDRRGTADELWGELTGLGLTGLLVPEGAAGIGGTMLDVGVVLEELGRMLHPGPYLASSVTAAGLVSALAGEEETELLTGIADGSRTAALALLEPDRRWRWHQPRTRATSDGTAWSVSGAKTRVPYGDTVDTLLVVADAGDELAVVAVDRGAAGVVTTPQPTVDGTRSWARVELDGASGRRLGDGDATAAVRAAVDRTIVATTVEGLGAAEAVLTMSVAYAGEREQFGRPIGSFQAVQHLCADMLTDVELARAGAYYALWACDDADPDERHRAATLAKAFASEALPRVGATGIQVHGGIGFTAEHDVGLYYKRLLGVQHELGGSGEHLDELATLVI